ncbi:MAG: peptidase S8/S53 subtilisin kexin sedolisin [Gammaproteobacteria bacterium]|nr:MAG: peptidase S8/S53 subtilisin kexin sedolisin [Gammaproteobacteria bacterium]
MDNVDTPLDVDIAVIDTGSQATHPDLRVVTQVNFTNELSPDDRNGHGTHVAGTAAALDNGAGVTGVAPGARIWSVKVLDRNGSGYLSDVIEGIDYVTANAASIEVANMSLGCQCQTAAMDEAIRRSVAAGVVYAVAAGNSAMDAATFSPANHPDVIAVSAVADFNGKPGGGAAATCRSDVDDTLADFSNFGGVVDIARHQHGQPSYGRRHSALPPRSPETDERPGGCHGEECDYQQRFPAERAAGIFRRPGSLPRAAPECGGLVKRSKKAGIFHDDGRGLFLSKHRFFIFTQV